MTLFGDDDGKIYAIKPKGDIFIQPIDLSHLSDDKVSFIGPETKVVTCRNDDVGLPTSPDYLEGPWLEKVAGRYILLHAAIYKDVRFPALLGYRTNAAYADNVLGPYKKDARGTVFFGGHLAVFDRPDGSKLISYRWEKTDRSRGLLCIDPLAIDPAGKVLASETLADQ